MPPDVSFKAKMHQICLLLLLAGLAYSTLPDSLSVFKPVKGGTLKGEGGEGKVGLKVRRCEGRDLAHQNKFGMAPPMLLLVIGHYGILTVAGC